MSKIGLIIEREYLSRVKKKSFIVMTFLSPFILLALVLVPLWLSSLKDNQMQDITVIDYTGQYKNVLTDADNLKFHYVNDSTTTLQNYKNKESGEQYAIIIITDNLLKNPKAITIYSEKQIKSEVKNYITKNLESYLKDEKIASYQIPGIEKMINDSKINIDIDTVRWSEDGSETESSTEIAMVIGIVCTMFIYMFLLLYGGQVMQGVMQEKTNRIVEVLVSSVKPFDLMMGKIVAIGLVGLTQLAIWLISFVGITFVVSMFMVSSGGSSLPPDMIPTGMDPQAMANGFSIQSLLGGINIIELMIYFILYFIGGYMLYASLFAAIGSAVDNESDTQQFVMPITMFIIFAAYAAMYSIENPDGPLAFWSSLIPFTSPIVMMVRIPFGVPFWQLLLSLAILAGSFIGTTWLSARIYRVGILMYGKKPSFKEMWKWLKYKG